MTDFAKEARDAMHRLRHRDTCPVELITDADYPCNCGLDAARVVVASLVFRVQSERAEGVAEGLARAAAALREHWLTGVHCDHATETDVATCYCSVWRSEPQPSVGAAVERWIEHVEAILAASPPDLTLKEGK